MVRARQGSHPLRRPHPGDLGRSATEDASPDYNSDTEGDRLSWWAIPGSHAVTKGILICTDYRSARAHAPGFAATAALSYSSGPGPCPDGRVSAQLGTVTQLPVHPASPVLLTKNGPLGALDSVAWLNKAATPSYLFKNLPAGSSYPEGNFGGNQLLDGSISLSPYTQVRRTICTSVSLRASTRVSPGFAPLRHSSPSFGSRQTHWSVFQDGPNGEPAGRRPEHAVHAPSRLADRLSPFHIRPRHIVGPIRFPPDNFKHSLTLFSKSFSSFPHGTCSLSVSRQYLALDGIYRPIRAAFPNNPTRRQRLVVRQGPGTTRLSPSPVPPSRGIGPGPPLRTLLETTIRTPRATDSHGGLFPVRSPLLRESLLVSFPPLIDMLKLSGHHPSQRPPPRTQFSTNRETLLPGSQHSPRFVPGTWPRHGGNDVQHPGRRALGLMASGATCVQRLDGSRDSAIHTKYRISLRSSSMQEPRYPLPRVFRISVSQCRPHDFNFLGAFGAGVLLLGQEDTTEGGAPPDTRGAEVPNTSSHP
ncbi:unnamed protein product [Lupinus luteus]|uniref:Uncharacterized protein n=1 Tax=Lupinus luteus TaxID=3873 RepID=A0AAV1VZB2_LUPLU